MPPATCLCNSQASIRLSVRPSVCSVIRLQQLHMVGLLLGSMQARDINWQRVRDCQAPSSNGAAAPFTARHSAANVGSVMLTAELTRLSTDLLNSLI